DLPGHRIWFLALRSPSHRWVLGSLWWIHPSIRTSLQYRYISAWQLFSGSPGSILSTPCRTANSIVLLGCFPYPPGSALLGHCKFLRFAISLRSAFWRWSALAREWGRSTGLAGSGLLPYWSGNTALSRQTIYRASIEPFLI